MATSDVQATAVNVKPANDCRGGGQEEKAREAGNDQGCAVCEQAQDGQSTAQQLDPRENQRHHRNRDGRKQLIVEDHPSKSGWMNQLVRAGDDEDNAQKDPGSRQSHGAGPLAVGQPAACQADIPPLST